MLRILDQIPSQESLQVSQWVLDHWDELVASHDGETVAVRDGRIVDSNRSFAVLDRRHNNATLLVICEQTREGIEGELRARRGQE